MLSLLSKLCLLFLIASPGIPGDPPSSVNGRVVDASGAAVGGASVSLTPKSGGRTVRTTTDAEGRFAVEALPSGTFRIEVAAAGFLAEKRDIAAGATGEPLEFVLQPSGADEVVTVSGGYASEIQTTATKVDIPLRDVPQSIQVINRQILDDQQAANLPDATRNVSGVTRATNYYGSTGNQISIRGFELDVNNNYFRDGFKFNNLGYSETVHLEQVEVLKGPASVLYGRAEPGGIVNTVTKKPLSDWYFGVQMAAARFNLYRPSWDLSGPLNKSKTLAFRVNGVYENSESFRDFNFVKRFFITPIVTWNIRPTTRLTLEALYLKDTRHSDYGLALVGDRPAAVPFSRSIDEPFQFSKFHDRQAGYVFEHEFSSNWRVRNGFRYSSISFYFNDAYPYFVDETPGATFGDVFRFYEDYDYPRKYTNSQTDLIGKFKTGFLEHNLVAGYEFGRQRIPSYGFYSEFPTINIFNPVYREFTRPPADRYANPDAPAFGFGNYLSLYRSNGLYFQDAITVHRKFKVMVGGRFDRYNQFFDDLTNQFDPAVATTINQSFSPRFGAVFQPNDALSFYASYSRSFAPPFPRRLRPGQSLRPEIGIQYEAGFKGNFFRGKLQPTISVYTVTKTNVLTADPNDPNFSIQIGAQRAKGVELDLTARPVAGFNLLFAYSFNQAQISKSGNEFDFPIGNLMPNAARHGGSFWGTYEFTRGRLNGLSVGGGVFAYAKRQVDLFNTGVLPGYARVDSSLGYRFKPGDRMAWRLSLNVNNLLNRRYWEAALGRVVVYPGAPRSAQITVQMNF